MNKRKPVKAIKGNDENAHHIFKIPEVRKKIIEIFGEPTNEFQRRMIENETMWAFNNLPKYVINKGKHGIIHENQKKDVHYMKYKIKSSDEKFMKNKTLAAKNKNLNERNIQLTNENRSIKQETKQRIMRERGKIVGMIKTAKEKNTSYDDLIKQIKSNIGEIEECPN